MILGNTVTQDIFRTYILGGGTKKTHIPFVLLIWPRHIGKTTLVKELSHELLGEYTQQDFLHIQDFSEKIGKRHNLKLRTNDANIVSKQLSEEFHYDDMGVEDITLWLQKSSTSGKKIVFLENIDRLIPDAWHALLKSLEEPLDGRIIIASASHVSAVLPTLISRALVLQFHALNTADMTSYIQIHHPMLATKDLIVVLAQGRPGLVALFVDLLDTIPSAFAVLEHVVRSWVVTDKYAFYKALSWFQKAWVVDIVLDALIAHFVQQGKYIMVQDWLYMKRYLDNNVSFENIALRTLVS